MLVKPINTVKTNLVFTSKNNPKQDNISNEDPMPSYGSDTFPVDKSLLLQRFNFHECEKEGISATDKTYDSFTGLRDKNYLLASLNLAIKNTQQNNKTLSVAMLDMDNFKSINELLGYKTGDKFIKEIAKSIIKTTQDDDVEAYRFGGDEFVLIFNNQPDSQKKEIVTSIAQGVNTNQTIQSYRDLYIRNAESRLDKALYSTAKVNKISELITKKETIEEVANCLTVQEAKNDPYFLNAINKIEIQINSIYRNLIIECLSKEQDKKNIRMLQGVQSKLASNKKLSEPEQKIFLDYLFSVYDKANEIYQTRKWMDDFKQNGGFGATCGIVNFEPEALEYKSAMDVIEKTSQVLKKCKYSKKGQVYLENLK